MGSSYIFPVTASHSASTRKSTFGDFCYLSEVRELEQEHLFQPFNIHYFEYSHEAIVIMLQFYDSEAPEGTLEMFINVPVFAGFEPESLIVGNYWSIVPWYVYFEDQLPPGTPPIHAVLQSSCGPVFTFQIDGSTATLISSNEDVHDAAYDHVYVSGALSHNAEDACEFTVLVYPTATYQAQYSSNNPVIYMVVVLSIFVLTTVAFLGFDWLVVRRQKALVITARKQNALVSSLFPVSMTQPRQFLHPHYCPFFSPTVPNILSLTEIHPKEVDGRHGRGGERRKGERKMEQVWHCWLEKLLE